MARPIRGIEIYLPLEYNDGENIPESKYISLQQELLARFGGVTSVEAIRVGSSSATIFSG